MKLYLLFLMSSISLAAMELSRETLHTESIVLESITKSLDIMKRSAKNAELSSSLTYYFLNKYLDNSRLTTHNKLIRDTLYKYGFSSLSSDCGKEKPLLYPRIAQILQKNKKIFINKEEAHLLLLEATKKATLSLYKRTMKMPTERVFAKDKLFCSLALMTIEESIKTGICQRIEESEVQKIFVNHQLSDGITPALHTEILEVVTPHIMEEIIAEISPKTSTSDETF